MYLFVILICTIVFLFVKWSRYKLQYWKRLDIVYPEPSLVVGNLGGIVAQREGFGQFGNHVYKYIMSQGQSFGGCYIFYLPVFVPIDPLLIKHIMVNDFQHFVDRGIYFNEENDPLSAHLFSIEGTKWKILRSKLTPTFTSGKMKMMFEQLLRCSTELLIEIDKKSQPLDVKDILARFTTDIIGSCAFGIDCNSLHDPENEFRKYGKVIFENSAKENVKSLISFVLPEFSRFAGFRMIRKEVADFFMKIVTDTVNFRESNNVYRKDFMHLLIQLKNKGELSEDVNVLRTENYYDDNSKITLNELAAQAFVFFIAGFETSSTTMTFALYELASNKEIQDKLRSEIDNVLKKHNGALCYEAILEMHYMENVINETLRKYPPLPSLNRICTKAYPIPGTDFVLEKGTKVIIPIYGLQHDERYFPDPEKFDPDRFTKEQKAGRPAFAFLPFGEGPRNCIGLRFGMMQTKVGLTTLLQNYSFTVSNKTKVPLEFDPRSFILSTKGDMWLNFTKIKQ